MTDLLNRIKSQAIPIQRQRIATPSAPAGVDPFALLLTAVGDAKIVMIGEASHGTEEFYAMRAEITERLINEKGFQIVACEADWPDCMRINKYVRNDYADFIDKDPVSALGEFKRFPRWMWRNNVVADFIRWLRTMNDGRRYEEKVGFYGLDLYSMHSSREEVTRHLEKIDPPAARRAKKLYACFDQYISADEEKLDVRQYAEEHEMNEACHNEVLQVLKDMNRRYFEQIQKDSSIAQSDKIFYAKMNAKVVMGAEEYYGNMLKGRNQTWNIRDTHMVSMLEDLINHLEQTSNKPMKAVVWAHNSHLGDARATERSGTGKVNIGHLVREKWGLDKTYNIGFTTYTGSVTAANEWGEPPHFFKVTPGMSGSVEQLFHQVTTIPQTPSNFMLVMRSNTKEIQPDKQLNQMLSSKQRLERAIGVIYRPQTERWSHYFNTDLPRQFDTVIHLDTTRALLPLEFTPQWKKGADEMDETYPFGE